MTKAYIAGFADKCAESLSSGRMPVKEAGYVKGLYNFLGRLLGSRGTLNRLEGMLAKARATRPSAVPKIRSWIADETAAVKKARRNALIGGAVALPMIGINAIDDENEPRWHSYSYETDDRW